MSKYLRKKNYLVYIWSTVICLFIVAIAVMITAIGQKNKYEQQIVEINMSHEEELISLREELKEEYELQIVELVQYYEYGGNVSQIEQEAEYIARVLYGMAINHTDSDRRAVVWCILNRVEHYAHPDTIIEVCEQPKQWIGYSSKNPVLESLYDLALEELKIWYSDGHRPMSSDYIYLTWSSKEILLRDTFEENKNTHYWRMK